MTKLQNDTWIWAIVENPDKNESFLGQHDKTNDIKFVPAFMTKEASLMCINLIAKNDALTYEPQAIFLEDLKNYCRPNGFMIFMLNEKGEIIDKISPEL